MDAVTNGDHTVIFLLLVHCTTTCYSKYQTEIEHVMSSVTVRLRSGLSPHGGAVATRSVTPRRGWSLVYVATLANA
jgi:hypothetical protein